MSSYGDEEQEKSTLELVKLQDWQVNDRNF
jgi:hypothetical protein